MLFVAVIVGLFSCEDYMESIVPQIVEDFALYSDSVRVDTVYIDAVRVDTVLFDKSVTLPIALEASGVAINEFIANWSGPDGITEYDLDIAKDVTFTDNLRTIVEIVGDSINDYKVTNLEEGTHYFYRVRSVRDSLTSGNSNVISTHTLPAAPLALEASGVGALKFVAEWEQKTGNTTYELDISEDVEFINNLRTFSDIGESALGAFNVTDLKANTRYYYRLRAVINNLTSENSNIIEVQTLPTAPVALNASGIMYTEFVANWEGVEGISQYELEVSQEPDFSTILKTITDIDGSTSSSFKVNGLQEDTRYYYRVRSMIDGLVSANSNVISLQTLLATKDPVVINNIKLSSSYFAGETETPIVTYKGDIYLAYVDQDYMIRVSKNGEVANFGFLVSSDPTHKAPSIAVDKNGYVHLTGGHHNKDWNYWVSKTPETLDFERVSGGLTQDWGITYSGFVKDRNDDLYTYYRYIRPNVVKKGSRAANIAKYDANTRTWTRLGDPDKGVFWMPYGMVSDATSGGWYQPFKVSLTFDANNIMHIACSVNDGSRFSATEVFYATYDGVSFRNKNGNTVSLPIDNNSNSFAVTNIPEASGWGCRVVWDRNKGAGVLYEHNKDHYVAWESTGWKVEAMPEAKHALYHFSSYDGTVVSAIVGGWRVNGQTYSRPSGYYHQPFDLDYFNQTGNIRYFRMNGGLGEVITIER